MLNAFELMKSMIEAGAAAVHFEDQLSSAKKCGHMGGKVLVPTREAIQKLVAARLAADVLDVPTVLIARTDANAAQLITSRFALGIALAAVLAIAEAWLGIVLAWYSDWPTTFWITVLSATVYVAAALVRRAA